METDLYVPAFEAGMIKQTGHSPCLFWCSHRIGRTVPGSGSFLRMTADNLQDWAGKAELQK